MKSLRLYIKGLLVSNVGNARLWSCRIGDRESALLRDQYVLLDAFIVSSSSLSPSPPPCTLLS